MACRYRIFLSACHPHTHMTQGACCTKSKDGSHSCSETLPENCDGGFMLQSTCSQKNICALAPASGIFGATADNASGLDAMSQLAAAGNKLDKVGKGACCVEDSCTDEVAREACSGAYNEGLSCSDARVQCGVFRIASLAGTEQPLNGAARDPAGMALGACCVDGGCSEGIESDCAGMWTSGARCKASDCAKSDNIPRGACCNPDSGECADGIEETACAAPAKWTKDGKCQPGGVCTGACCNGGRCTQKLKRDCPGEWTLYKDCKLGTCPRPADFVSIASGGSVSVLGMVVMWVCVWVLSRRRHAVCTS